MTSSAAKGSSKRRILGSEIREIAITSFFLSPPDSSLALMFLTGSNSNLEIRKLIFSFPEKGEHNSEILKSLGYQDEDLLVMEHSGVFGRKE